MTPEQFTYIYNEYSVRLLFYARKIVGQEYAPDIVSDVFIKLWQQGDIPDNARAWLYACARNKCLDWCRRNTFEQRYIKSLEEPVCEIKPIVIDKLLNSLTKKQRRILQLYIEGYKVSEIAEVIGIREQSVKNERSRAIHSLRKTV